MSNQQHNTQAQTPTESAAKIFPVIQSIIAHGLAYDLDEITQDTSFDEDDLDILNTPGHQKIIAQIQKHFSDLQLETDMLRDCITVAEIVSLIEEEQEFADM